MLQRYKVLIGPNLHAALMQIVTLPMRSAYIWVDYICIDQSNSAEQQHQILLMPQVYKQAHRVWIWLGISADQSDRSIFLLLTLIDLLQAVDRHEPLTDMQTQWYDIVTRHLDYGSNEFFEQMWMLLSRSWFGRMWTLQEGSLSSDTCTVLCGSKAFQYSKILEFGTSYMNDDAGHWVKLVRGIRPISDGADPENPPRPIMIHTKAVLRMRHLASKSSDTAVIKLLNYLRPLECTEPRDRIMCMASVLPVDLVDTIRAQIPLSAEALYTLLASHELDRNNIHCLSAAGLSQQRSSYPVKDGSTVLRLPSWTPDWTYRKRYESFWVLDDDLFELRGCHLYDATRGMAANMSTFVDADGTQVAVVSGIILDKIVDHSDLFRVYRFPAGYDTTQQPELLLEFFVLLKQQIEDYTSLALNYLRLSDPDATKGEKLAAVRETLVGNLVSEFPSSGFAGVWIRAQRAQIEQMFADLEVDIEEVREACRMKQQQDHKPNEVKSGTQPEATRPLLSLSIGTACKGRCFFATEGGRIGLGPEILQNGDNLCLFLGARTPFVIRSVADAKGTNTGRESRFWLIGESYVYGMMDGEYVKTDHELPQSVQLV